MACPAAAAPPSTSARCVRIFVSLLRKSGLSEPEKPTRTFLCTTRCSTCATCPRSCTGCAHAAEPDPEYKTLAMLWAHEVLRVFSDRLIDHNSIHDDERKCSGGTLAACGHQLTQDAVQDEQELSKSSVRALRTSFAPSRSSSSATTRRWACRETITRKSLRSTTAQVAVAGSSHLAAGGSGALKRSTSRS
jgi:hypothetical protein